MKIRALKSFCGTLTMAQGDEREYSDETVLSDLLKAGYIEEIIEEIPEEQPSKRKAVKENESKRSSAG